MSVAIDENLIEARAKIAADLAADQALPAHAAGPLDAAAAPFADGEAIAVMPRKQRKPRRESRASLQLAAEAEAFDRGYSAGYKAGDDDGSVGGLATLIFGALCGAGGLLAIQTAFHYLATR